MAGWAAGDLHSQVSAGEVGRLCDETQLRRGSINGRYFPEDLIMTSLGTWQWMLQGTLWWWATAMAPFKAIIMLAAQTCLFGS